VFNYVVGLSLVFSSWLSLLLLCVLFRYNVHSSIATRAVPTYLRLVTGVLFLPSTYAADSHVLSKRELCANL
jgi:hypothetical protein